MKRSAAELLASPALPTATVLDSSLLQGGLSRGKLTEICGPPGAGKTRLAKHVAHALTARKERVIWVDTKSQTSLPINELHAYVYLPTLLHLLAWCQTEVVEADLLVLDDISTPFAIYPWTKGNVKRGYQCKRRAQTRVFHELAAVAVKHNMAVLMLSQMTTSFKEFGSSPDGARRAMLEAAVQGECVDMIAQRLTLLRRHKDRIVVSRGEQVELDPSLFLPAPA